MRLFAAEGEPQKLGDIPTGSGAGPHIPLMRLTNEGLLLGRGVVLAKMDDDGLRIEEDRILTLLAVAQKAEVPQPTMRAIDRASHHWRFGDKALAAIHLAQIGLQKIDEKDGERLALAAVLLDAGMTAKELARELGLKIQSRVRKYDHNQPRVPAGSGRESGRWTSGGGGAGANHPAPTLIGHGQVLSDISVEPAGPTVQVAQSVTAKDPPDGTPVAPYGERVVSFNKLPMNTRQILQYRVFSQDDKTGEWKIGMDLPMAGTAVRITTKTRGQGAETDDSGLVFSPPGSPPLPEEESREEPRSGLRYGQWNPYTQQPYFKAFNDSGQAISPVTGRTVSRKSSEAHYPVDPVRSWSGSAFNSLLHGLFGGE